MSDGFRQNQADLNADGHKMGTKNIYPEIIGFAQE
jgi:hypothetical protein